MGHHYIPQYYLSGFAPRTHPSSLWVYEKGSDNIRLLPIRSLVQENKFYSDKKESYLADEIERPANKVLEKIKNLRRISLEEKLILSKYIIVFWKRVPEAKRRLKSIAPKISNDLAKAISFKLDNLIKNNPEKTELLEKRKLRAQDILGKFKINPPKDIWLNVISPETTPKATEALSQMHWTFLVCEEPMAFLTNDNPIFIHKSLGIGNKYSELTFPISSYIALLAAWWNVDREYIHVDNQIIKEINRRVASTATRFFFYNKKREWIVTLINKREHRLNIIAP